MNFWENCPFWKYLQHLFFQQIHDPDVFLIVLLLASSLTVTYLFLYCYFGKVSAGSFEKMADCVYDMNWQKLPVRWQRYIILMIESMQKPLYYYGFKMIKLELNTFIKVRGNFGGVDSRNCSNPSSLGICFVWISRSLLFILTHTNKLWKMIRQFSNNFQHSFFVLQLFRTVITYYLMFKTITSKWNIYKEPMKLLWCKQQWSSKINRIDKTRTRYWILIPKVGKLTSNRK